MACPYRRIILDYWPMFAVIARTYFSHPKRQALKTHCRRVYED